MIRLGPAMLPSAARLRGARAGFSILDSRSTRGTSEAASTASSSSAAAQRRVSSTGARSWAEPATIVSIWY
jgi:hypothetical protein